MSTSRTQSTASGWSEGNTDGLDSLADVIAILRYKDRQHLAALLTAAYVNFEYLDMGFSYTSDAEIVFVNGVIHAPISACMALRDLSQKDQDDILDALQEVWPVTEAGGMYIKNISFNISKDSLGDELTHLFTREPLNN